MRMSLMTLFQWLSIVTGFLAAGFWFWSARVRLPTTIISGWGGSGGTAQELGNKLHAQGHISAAAASFSGLSLLCQAIAQLLAPLA
jgi:hypothetical protein